MKKMLVCFVMVAVLAFMAGCLQVQMTPEQYQALQGQIATTGKTVGEIATSVAGIPAPVVGIMDKLGLWELLGGAIGSVLVSLGVIHVGKVGVRKITTKKN